MVGAACHLLNDRIRPQTVSDSERDLPRTQGLEAAELFSDAAGGKSQVAIDDYLPAADELKQRLLPLLETRKLAVLLHRLWVTGDTCRPLYNAITCSAG
jgi:hypothetical protein